MPDVPSLPGNKAGFHKTPSTSNTVKKQDEASNEGRDTMDDDGGKKHVDLDLQLDLLHTPRPVKPVIEKEKEKEVHEVQKQPKLKAPLNGWPTKVEQKDPSAAAPPKIKAPGKLDLDPAYLMYKQSYLGDVVSGPVSDASVGQTIDKLLFEIEEEEDVLEYFDDIRGEYLTIKDQIKEDVNFPYNNFTVLVHHEGGALAGAIAALHPEAKVLAEEDVLEYFDDIRGEYLTIKDQIKEDVNFPYNNFTVLVHHEGGALAGAIAALHPEAKVLAMCGDERECAKNATMFAETGNAIIGGRNRGLGAMVDEIHEGAGRLGVGFATYQYFGDLVEVCEGLLPYECEQAVGNLMLLSSTSFFPKELPDVKYFEFWKGDTMKLLHPGLEFVRRKYGVDVGRPMSVRGKGKGWGWVQMMVYDEEGKEIVDVENLPNKIDMQEDEKGVVEEWFKVLRREDLGGSVLISGSGGGMLGSKLAYEGEGKSVVVVVRGNDKMHSRRHVVLNEFLGVENLIICEGEVGKMQTSAIIDAGKEVKSNLFDIHIGGIDLVSGVLFNAINPDAYVYAAKCEQRLDNFEVELGKVMSLVNARGSNYFALPDGGDVVKAVNKVLGGECASEVKARLGNGVKGGIDLVKRANLAVGGAEKRVSVVKEGNGGVLLEIKGVRPVVQMGTGKKEAKVSLYVLLWLGLERRSHRKRLARMLLEGGVWGGAGGGLGRDASPWNLFVKGVGKGLGERGDRKMWKSIKAEIEKDLELEEGEEGVSGSKFSFMEIGGAGVGELAADDYVDATIISILNQEEEAQAATDRIVEGGVWNHAVCTKETVGEVAKNLYESPELMRYSYWNGLSVFLDGGRREGFGKILGGLFTSALTNFVSLPTSAEWSLVWKLFGEEKVAPYGKGADGWKVKNHPVAGFHDFERRFLGMETEVYGGDTKVAIGVLDGQGLVRVDVVNATRAVHHHYDFKKDGHQRTYTMHISSDDEKGESEGGSKAHLNNGKWTRVWLTRDMDGHFIPYNTIKSLTLIAVLRMGLVPELKAHAYKEFIGMPLYEDMAPWNIVMEGQGYNYIDYDTRDKTFDAYIPHAYQILSVLMNYKRTVKDFEHCGGNARTPYGFGLVSDCVGSSFKGPCEDPEFPVPCATKEGTCESDFISCLRAIGDEELEEEGAPEVGCGGGIVGGGIGIAGGGCIVAGIMGAGVGTGSAVWGWGGGMVGIMMPGTPGTPGMGGMGAWGMAGTPGMVGTGGMGITGTGAGGTEDG
ncbi:hypothetical protein TL16_g04354 [Triparma laevis f. inornata]|uniref:Uncharacterized protein n=1 Tax=Triparma laevis f. inornata TaxID=1714386 RepID=A0A9W7A5I1_9STRA|nr:hypothetical protein TL16_g04354 [Triparma laevis f. inornata]